MNTQTMTIESNSADGDKIARAADALRRGELVAFPTETVYGLGANALDAQAVARIFEAKGRPATNPVIVHVATVEAAKALVTEWPEAAARLAEKFWPGPLTLVLPNHDVIPDIVTAGGPTVALRVPSHPVALALLRAAAVPIAAPSANRSMQLSPTTAAHVASGLAGRIEMILDGGPTTGGIESTVVSLISGLPVLLRPGLISPDEIEAIIGPMQRGAHRNEGTVTSSAPLPSPGMLARHYAPATPLELAADGNARVVELLKQGDNVGWLTFRDPPASLARDSALTHIIMPSDPKDYAARLYAVLHQLDENNLSRIVVDALPDSVIWLALRDRLVRASTSSESK